ncbi:uncharacterized protein [Littorina saxatilis]|uniref:uncharacterized protein n=1 Tax=Littorina saxatilis TaxID=31220 RepID=UPI0038B4EED0
MATHRNIFLCAGGVLLLYSHSQASTTSAVKHGQGIQSRPGSELSTLALDVDLDGSDLHLDLDQDLDQDSQIPLYELYADDQGETQVRRIWTETNVTLYQNKQHDSAFGIVSKRNKNGTVSTALQGFIVRGDQLYEAKSKQSDDSTKEATQAENNPLLFDLDLTEVQAPQLLQAVDDGYKPYFSLDAAVKEKPSQDRADIPSSRHTRRKRQTVTQDVIIDVVALVDYPIYYKWYKSSEEISESAKKQDALDNIFQLHAFIFNGVNLRYKSIGNSLPYTIHIKLSAIVVATTGEASPWTETRRQEDTNTMVDIVDGYAAIADLEDWAKNTTSLPAYDHLMLFTGYNLTDASGIDTMQGKFLSFSRSLPHPLSFSLRPKKKNCLFLVTRPTLNFGADPKLFFFQTPKFWVFWWW